MDQWRSRLVPLLTISIWQCPEEILPKVESPARNVHTEDGMTHRPPLGECNALSPSESQFYTLLSPDVERFNFGPVALRVRG